LYVENPPENIHFIYSTSERPIAYKAKLCKASSPTVFSIFQFIVMLAFASLLPAVTHLTIDWMLLPHLLPLTNSIR
jgi:hypothetical protein